jgi:hypothetical protein
MKDPAKAAYKAALLTERDAWHAVKDNLPGSPTYDAVKWSSWRFAIREVTIAFDKQVPLREPRHRFLSRVG